MINIKEKYIVDTKGNTTNVILSKKDYDRLVEYIQELEDVTAYDRAKAGQKGTASWKKVKRQHV
ncbi:MAG TPA: hypothetical protein PK926_02825 [Spirochaetota bacterium]|nr:hypothetical protein [Spirochaetota bacterium]HPI87986.1 hypothetical protein [Spirochaetota bacterium]HPR46697.1 hypothetical protein [Spirochaetota bacterium]